MFGAWGRVGALPTRLLTRSTLYTLQQQAPYKLFTPTLATITPMRTMKHRSIVKKMCEFCKIIKRGKKRYVKCEKNPKHKQVTY